MPDNLRRLSNRLLAAAVVASLITATLITTWIIHAVQHGPTLLMTGSTLVSAATSLATWAFWKLHT